MELFKTIFCRRIVAGPILVAVLLSLQFACSKNSTKTSEPTTTYNYKPLELKDKGDDVSAATESNAKKSASRGPSSTGSTATAAKSAKAKSAHKSKSSAAHEAEKTYVVQIGAFSKKENAEQLLKQLEEKKYPVFIKMLEHKTLGSLFLVRLQPTKDRSEAEKYLTMLKDNDKLQPTLIIPKAE
jgi:cell division septation protein DedD